MQTTWRLNNWKKLEDNVFHIICILLCATISPNMDEGGRGVWIEWHKSYSRVLLYNWFSSTCPCPRWWLWQFWLHYHRIVGTFWKYPIIAIAYDLWLCDFTKVLLTMLSHRYPYPHFRRKHVSKKQFCVVTGCSLLKGDNKCLGPYRVRQGRSNYRKLTCDFKETGNIKTAS